ncbi:TPA: toll-Interleukin receptor, partial [Enterobacter kobei]|nr:toll-Interleukin receptor [Enterobacter kobei]
MVLTHRSVDKINLSDIYVSCDMQPLDYAERNEKITSAKVYSSNVLFEQKDIYLISGEEQQGKTTLLKQIYKELLKKEIQPVYFDAKGIKSSELSKCFDGALAEQYENSNYDEFMKVSQ